MASDSEESALQCSLPRGFRFNDDEKCVGCALVDITDDWIRHVVQAV